MKSRTIGLCAVLAMGSLLGSGCGARSHLSADFGKSTRTLFARQVINPDAGDKALANLGLDSQEAALVADSYRRSLTPKGARAEEEEQPMIILAPPVKAGSQPKLAPSVPPGER